MSDTLGTIRRALRSAKSAERRALRHKMARYNPLASKGKTPDNLYDAESAKTTQDVISETLDAARYMPQKGRVPRFQDSSDRLLHECSIVSPEVRDTWRAKVGMSSLLSDDIKAKLTQQSGACAMKTLRESRLNDLAKWMVWMWCDEEGYDPDKHPSRTK
jgi:hypothetical protein